MAEEDHVGRRGLAAGDDRIVRQLVEEDDAARAHDVLDDGDVGEVTRDQRHHRFDADEIGQRLLEVLVAGPLAADEARGKGAEAGHVERVGGRRLDRRVVAEAEVIVIGEGHEALAARRGVLAGLVDGDEEGVVLGKIGAAGEAETLVGEIGEALLLVHVSVSSVCSSIDCLAARRTIMTFRSAGLGIPSRNRRTSARKTRPPKPPPATFA